MASNPTDTAQQAAEAVSPILDPFNQKLGFFLE